MGQAVAASVGDDPNTRVAAGIDLGDSLEEALAKSDTVIDFTLPSFTNELIEGCVAAGKALVMGTTGHDDAQLKLIRDASKSIPIVHAPNYSVGVNTLSPHFRLAALQSHRDAQSRPKVGPKSAQSRPKVGPKSVGQSRPKVGPKSAQSRSAQSRPKVAKSSQLFAATATAEAFSLSLSKEESLSQATSRLLSPCASVYFERIE